MENLKLILAVVLLVAYAGKRVWQKVTQGKSAKPFWKESETLGFIVGEVILLAEEVQNLLGGE
jgi:hypothetical protein